jgi:hypothetical protein
LHILAAKRHGATEMLRNLPETVQVRGPEFRIFKTPAAIERILGIIDYIDAYGRCHRDIISLQQFGALNGIADKAPVDDGGFARLVFLLQQLRCFFLFPVAIGVFGRMSN